MFKSHSYITIIHHNFFIFKKNTFDKQFFSENLNNLHQNFSKKTFINIIFEKYFLKIIKVPENIDLDDVKAFDINLPAPPLLIKEDQSSKFPNVYHILQCLTTKNASDNFDLERYEIIVIKIILFTFIFKLTLIFEI